MMKAAYLVVVLHCVMAKERERRQNWINHFSARCLGILYIEIVITCKYPVSIIKLLQTYFLIINQWTETTAELKFYFLSSNSNSIIYTRVIFKHFITPVRQNLSKYAFRLHVWREVRVSGHGQWCLFDEIGRPIPTISFSCGQQIFPGLIQMSLFIFQLVRYTSLSLTKMLYSIWFNKHRKYSLTSPSSVSTKSLCMDVGVWSSVTSALAELKDGPLDGAFYFTRSALECT